MQVPAFYSLLADITRKERRGLEVGLIDSSWNVFYGIASIFSGMLITVFGFSLIFSLASILHFVSSVVIIKRMKEVS
jgi:MFS family permease